jgi:hypothetical protein
MSAPAHPVTAQLVTDLSSTLARLKFARQVGDESEIRVCQRRLDWLLDKLPRKADL